MKKKYRIREKFGLYLYSVEFVVEVKTWLGIWVKIKSFHDQLDPEFARLEAEELLEKLQES